MSEKCADLWSPKTLRGSQGVQFFINCIIEQDLKQWISNYPYKVMALTLNGKPLFKHKLTPNMAILVGNEGSGISNSLFECISEKISLPMHKDVESINVGAAASAFMYEYYRQMSVD